MSYLFPPKRNDKSDIDAFVAGVKRVKDRHEAENAQCPVCGYYCLGNGGNGCIDKPSMLYAISQKEEA
jgi:hypothetical protein